MITTQHANKDAAVKALLLAGYHRYLDYFYNPVPDVFERDRAGYQILATVNADGTAGETECLVGMPRACPDGVTLDAEGHVWIGCWRPDAIYRLWMPARRLELFVWDYRGEYLRGPTALCWAGPNRDVLVAASLVGRTLQRLDVGVVGQPVNYPAL